MMRKLPIGIQGFEKIRTDGFLYVDKTEYIYRLVHNNVPYFLSRPRRFGKSLLLSAMKAYWEGKKELFSGLAIEKLEEAHGGDWKSYPVFYFDFNGVNYRQQGALEEALSVQLKRWESAFGCIAGEGFLSERFQNLLIAAKEMTGLRSVVLVDEYDKPLLDAMEDERLLDHNKGVFKGFFSTLKSFDEYIQFIFITGVSKFHKVSIFSDLNQLRDISMSEEYSGLCGITLEADPFEHYFQAVIYLVFMLLGKFALCEMHTCTGRIDCKVETDAFIYLFEFKRDDAAEAALEQIDTKDYALAFAAASRKLYKIGVSFDSKSRMLVGWEVRGE